MSDSARTILIAEDEEQLRRLLVLILSQAGFRLLIAEDGQAAWELLQEHGGMIDLLLSNIVMPRMTGVDLAERASRVRPEMKVLLVSAYDEGLLVLGKGWEFLPKPFAASELLNKVKELLGG